MFKNPFKPVENWDDPINHSLFEADSTHYEDYPILFTGLPKPLAFTILAAALAGKILKDTIFPNKIGSFFEKSHRETQYIATNDDYPIEI